MSHSKVIINLIQDLATPHNNVLIEHFIGREDVEIKLWYAQAQEKNRYQWNTDISQQHCPATIYGNGVNFDFLRYCLAHRDERFVIVGWMNSNTRLLHLLFTLLRRPFNHWTDMPSRADNGMPLRKRTLRWLAYRLLRYSRSRVFGVGITTVEFLRALGFPEHRLFSLPIFVSVDEDIMDYQARREEMHRRYMVPRGGFLLSAGSRLIFSKGYDLLIKAIADLPDALRHTIKLVIVGSGEESVSLQGQIKALGLQDTVQIENWLDIADFKALIANSAIFIHPSRFDSYGGTTLGMALGVPVIGSTGAGAAVDRIEHGVNGLLYDATDTKALAGHIAALLEDSDLRQRIGHAGRETALHWHPSRGVEILLQYSI